MDKKINQEFLKEISKIKDIVIFMGIANLLGVKTENEDKSPKDFHVVLEEIMKKFESKERRKRKELVKILRKANAVKDSEEATKNGKN